MPKIMSLLLAAICMLMAGCTKSTAPPPQLFQPKDEHQQRIQQLIDSFIATHEIWERDAHTKRLSTNMANGNTLTQSGKEMLDATQASYQDTLRPFFVKNAPLRLDGFGSPPRHEAAFEKIISLVPRGNEFMVRTQMIRRNGTANFTDEYEYIVVFEDGEPKIRSLKWISDE